MSEHEHNSLPEYALLYPSLSTFLMELSSWTKSLLLFFDGICGLVPSNRWLLYEGAGREALSQPLRERRLLRFIDPAEVIDPDAVTEIFDAALRILEAARFQRSSPARLDGTYSARFGLGIDRDIAFYFMTELMDRGLMHKLEELDELGHDYVVARDVLTLVMGLSAQFLRPRIREKLELDALPSTWRPEAAAELPHLVSDLAGPRPETSAVLIDLAEVTINLESVPLDEVLDFREQYGHEFRAYRRSLHQYAATVAAAPAYEGEQLRRDRQELLRDLRSDLVRRTRLAFRLKQAVPFLLGIAGGGVGGLGGIGWGVVGGAASSVAGSTSSTRGTAFSYLFRAEQQWISR